MPCDYTRYPDNWPELRRAVLLRAHLCCEGSPAFPSCRARQGFAHPDTGALVALAVAHKHGTATMTTDLDDLLCLCQRCHNCYDATQRRKHAAATRQRKLTDDSHIPLFHGRDSDRCHSGRRHRRGLTVRMQGA